MRLEYIFDTVCPWCWIGKRRFENALALRPGTRVDMSWRPFMLNLDVPLEGVDRQSYMERRFGGSRLERMHGAIVSLGRTVGIEFDFRRVQRTPNSLHSHRLVRFAGAFGLQSETVEALYRAYFCEGRDIGSLGELVLLGGEVGLPRDELGAYLGSDADVAAMMNENARAHRLGVNGVPCLILDGRYALAGAQESEIMLRLIDAARETAGEETLG
ncbi:MAG: DsbA family oxidoreductase [Magnetospirillum sp.]|nr:DsbA family oxidoreductase [Magnetospirillum sp.]